MEKFYKFYAFWVNMEKVFAWGNDGGGGGAWCHLHLCGPLFCFFAKLLKLTCMFVPRGKEISVHMRIAKMVG